MGKAIAGIVGEHGLYAIVNNAGICVVGPVECVTLEEWRRQFEVNFFGPIAILQRLLPLMRAYHSCNGDARPRIININSATGVVATPVFGAYSASKAALKTMADCLRLELRAQGIFVSSIFPGIFKTEIWRKEKEGMERVARRPVAREVYGELIENVSREVFKTAEAALPAEGVARVVERALVRRVPRERYFIGWSAHVGNWAVRFMPGRMFEFLMGRWLGVPRGLA
jgi:NAD(P)-dependent dehydrogenase (short-subunit alcohol dehydrogenase family)